MKMNNQGMTLVSVVVMVVILAIIASLSIITSTKTVKEAKEMQRKENLVIIQSMVNKVGVKKETAGYLTPADTKIYGKQLDNSIIAILLEDDEHAYELINGEKMEDWYILEQDDIEEMGITYNNEVYFVNYSTGEVCSRDEFASRVKGAAVPLP